MNKSKFKKEFFQKLDSELPEIDGMFVTKKTPRQKPLIVTFFASSVAALATAAVVITAVNLNSPAKGTQEKNDPAATSRGGKGAYSRDPSRMGGDEFKYDFTKGGTPSFNSFPEVAYYSYLLSGKVSLTNKQNSHYTQYQRSNYVDEEGRDHYPIETEEPFTFSDFLFFEFTSTDMGFFQDKIGNGLIRGLSVQTNICSEMLLILKNGNTYYSCLTNGGGEREIEFSSHKYIEGFEIIKDLRYFKIINLELSRNSDYSSLSKINVDGFEYLINANSVHYMNTSVSGTIDDLKAFFN